MKIKTTAKEIIKKIETSKSGLPEILLIMEALVEIEKDGASQNFRLRELDEKTKIAHVKWMKIVKEDKLYNQETQESLDNEGRKIKLSDLTESERDELASLANEVIDHFKK